MTLKELDILVETNIVYDLNWIYFRRKIILFNQFLNLWLQKPFIIIHLYLKIIWYKYYIWFNEVINNG